MLICFHEHAFEDYKYFQMHDKKIIKRINELIKDIKDQLLKVSGSLNL